MLNQEMIKREMNYALITGASSGIGYELTRLFAINGHNLILVARREDILIQLADNLGSNHKINVLIFPIDLSYPDSAEEIFEWVQKKSLTVDYLVNNAGFYVNGAFLKTRWEDEQKMILMQCFNHTRLTKLLLPGMSARGEGAILNIGSTGSFVPGPYNAVYCAVKSFVLSFSEAIAEEVSGSGVTVTALCPGGTKTAFQDFINRRRSTFFPMMEASKVAATGYKALMKGKRVVIPGMVNKMQVFMVRFLPRKLVAKISACLSA